MEITWHDLKNKLNFLNIIDIRDNYLYNVFKVNGSKNIPFQFLITNPSDYLDKNKTYYLLCEYGNKSKMVSEILNKEDYHTYSIIGGIKEYQNINNITKM